MRGAARHEGAVAARELSAGFGFRGWFRGPVPEPRLASGYSAADTNRALAHRPWGAIAHLVDSHAHARPCGVLQSARGPRQPSIRNRRGSGLPPFFLRWLRDALERTTCGLFF